MTDPNTITFQYHDVEPIAFIDKRKADIRLWLSEIAAENDFEIEMLTYVFGSDSFLLSINKQYLNHDYFTDIITFPLSTGRSIESDILISIERVEDNATKLNVAYEHELLRVIAHGLLHLVGYTDKSAEEKKEMRLKEDLCLQVFNFND